MRHKKLKAYKRRTSDAIEHKTIKKLRKSRRSQMVSSKFSLFPSGIFPAEKDSEGLKKLKKFKMKIYLIVMSIEGYLKKLTSYDKSMHFGGGKESPISEVKRKLKNLNTDEKFDKNVVDNLVEKIVKLRVLALKEVEDVKEKKTFDQRIDFAKEKLKEVNSLLKQWHAYHGEFLEKQNQLVINKDPLVLDFRRVNHQLTDDQSRRILSELKQSWDDSGKKDAGEMMKRVLEVFRVAGQRCFQEDQERSDSKEDEYNKKIQEEKKKKEEEERKMQEEAFDWDTEMKELDEENEARKQKRLEDGCSDLCRDEYKQYKIHNGSGQNRNEDVVQEEIKEVLNNNDGWNSYSVQNRNDEIQDENANNNNPFGSDSDDWNSNDDLTAKDEVEDEQESEKPVERKTSKRPHHNKSPQYKDGGKESRDSPVPNRGPKRSKSGKLNNSSSLDYNKKLKRKLEFKVARYEKKIANLDSMIKFKLDKLNK